MKKIILILTMIVIALVGMAGAHDAPGAGDAGGFGGLGMGGEGGLLGDGPGFMGLDPGDLGMKDGSYTMVGAPGAELPMPNFGADAWISAHIGGPGGSADTGYAGLPESTKPQLVMIINNTTQKVTFYNRDTLGLGIDIGSLRLVKVLGRGPQKRYEDIAELPYTLIVEGGKSQTLDLYENVTSGDEIILTNGMGIYTGLKIP